MGRPSMSLRVVNTQPARPPKPVKGLRDKIFFTKDDITIGRQLTNVGSLYAGSTWTVIGIRNYDKDRAKNTDHVTRINDDIRLQHNETREVRQVRFAAICWSAIWRLAD